MYIDVKFDDEKILPKHFVVCEFYGVETCFCWDADRLVIFPYTDDSTARNIKVVSTPGLLRKIQFFDSRAFFICTPQGAYKLSRSNEFALLSKNALGMGSEYFQVLVAKNSGVYLDDKQVKSSTLLFSVDPNAVEMVCTFPLILENTEMQFVSCLIAGSETNKNLCIIAHYEKLFVLNKDTVQLIYNNDDTIVNIVPVKRQNKIAGLLLSNVNMNKIILVHSKGNDLVFEKIHLGRDKTISALCASFSLQSPNVLWIVCCDQSKTYYIRKELFVDIVQEIKVEERTFSCIQHYKPNVLLGLSQRKELVEFSLENLENSLSTDNNINLHTDMFKKTDIIMEEICERVKELNVLYEKLADEQNKLRRINLYALKQKLQIIPDIEVSRICNYHYLTLSIPDKLIPKNSYVLFAYVSQNQNTFCMKKVTETALTVKMPINENRILCSSAINMDLITLINEEHLWCIIPNFINSPTQNLRKKRGSKKDKTTFIDTKITSLENLIKNKDLNMTKLREIKEIIRREL